MGLLGLFVTIKLSVVPLQSHQIFMRKVVQALDMLPVLLPRQTFRMPGVLRFVLICVMFVMVTGRI